MYSNPVAETLGSSFRYGTKFIHGIKLKIVIKLMRKGLVGHGVSKLGSCSSQGCVKQNYINPCKNI